MARTLHEFCERWNISLRKARLMDKEGDLRLSGSEKPIDAIRLALKTSSRRLNVAQLVYLIENPDEALELGPYGRLAEAAIEALDKPKGQVAPPDVTAQILDAYNGEPAAVEIIAKWLASIIPGKPVNHAYLAVRLMLGVPEGTRKYDFPRVQRVFKYARAHPAMAGLWKTVRQASQNVTYYQKLALDL